MLEVTFVIICFTERLCIGELSMGIDALGRLPAILLRGDNIYDFLTFTTVCCSVPKRSLEMEHALKRRINPEGANSLEFFRIEETKLF